jgi:hypothetical protein
MEQSNIKEEVISNEVIENKVALDESKEDLKEIRKGKQELSEQAELDAVKDSDLKVVAKLLQDIREDNEKQMKYVKTQLRLTQFFTFILVIFIVFFSIGIVSYVPRLNALLNDTNVLMGQATEAITQTSGVIDNLNKVTTDLADADITGMLNNVDSLVVSSEENMAVALEKVNEIDIESLNKAIKDLQAVVSPLAKLFGK